MQTSHKKQILKQDQSVRVVRVGDRVIKTVYGINEGFCRFLNYSPEEMVDREIKALMLLEDLDGIQEFIERIGADTLVTRYVEGKNLGELTKDEMPKDYFKELKNLVMQCNSRGVYRVGSKQDFIVSPDGSPAIIDFGSVLFQDNSLLRIPGARKLVEYKVTSKLKRIEREFYQKP